MSKSKKKKIKIPKSVLDLNMSPKKFAKKHGIRLKGKGMSKGERKHNRKRLKKEYAAAALNGMNKAVKILAENASSDSKKIQKVKTGVETIIINTDVMVVIAKLYKKHPESYPNLKFLPELIMYTLEYYNSENASDEDKEIGKVLDVEALVKFCEKILKKEIKKYKKCGLDDAAAYELAAVSPTAKIYKNNRERYRKLINRMYIMAANDTVDIEMVLKSVLKIDKKKAIDKKEFLTGFFGEFIMTMASNSKKTFTETQQELHENLIERTLVFLNEMKPKKLKELLKIYIKRRKTAEQYKKDKNRVIKFVDHATSNSPYETIKKVVQELISDNSANEMYLN